jgi:hypothetical protein
VEAKYMTEESGLTREEIEALDDELVAREDEPSGAEAEVGAELLSVRSQEPEAKS